MIATEDWTPADKLTLEPSAMTVVKSIKGCYALTAGPGAGKTEMLAQRADFLLRTQTCRYPKRILAISFKTDASGNLRDRVIKRCGHELATRFDSFTFHAFAKKIIDRFRPILIGLDALDSDYKIGEARVHRKQITFSDLVPFAISILESSDMVRNIIKNTYTDVFLDEFQDCTNLQYKLIQLAFLGTNARIVSVGDSKQRIMGWAGALEGIFKTYADDFSATPLRLYLNFRSKPRLLRLQNEIIRVLEPESVMPEGSLDGEEGKILIECFTDAQAEAVFIAGQIQNWLEVEHIPAYEIAILISKQIDLYAHCLMDELNRLNIPFRNEQQLQDLSNEPITQLLVDFVLCIYSEHEPKSWIKLHEKIATFDDIDHSSVTLKISSYIQKESKSYRQSKDYSNWWENIRFLLKTLKAKRLITLSPSYESVDYLKQLVLEFKQELESILSLEVDLIEALIRFSGDNAIRLLTIHKSKGLEFDSVIMMAIEKEIFFGKERDERCAFFVGASRAKRQLLLTHTNSRSRPNNHSGRWNVNRAPYHEFLNYCRLVQ